jgi:hypothetical protein
MRVWRMASTAAANIMARHLSPAARAASFAPNGCPQFRLVVKHRQPTARQAAPGRFWAPAPLARSPVV